MANYNPDKIYTESFVFYESTAEVVEKVERFFGKEAAFDFVKAVMEYGLWGVVPDDNDIVWGYGFDAVIASINSAKNRYIKSCEDGSKGGRPKIQIDEDELRFMKEDKRMSNGAIAKHFGCSPSTISRRCQELGIAANDEQFMNNEINELGM